MAIQETSAAAAKLQWFAQRARQVMNLRHRLFDNPEVKLPDALREPVQRAGELAADLLRAVESPVSIGFVGEFSAGKTVLLGSLIGLGDGLPISELPTTGNVTALYFVQATEAEIQDTVIESVTLEYLNHAQVAGCLAYMLLEAKARSAAAHVSADRLNYLRGQLLQAIDDMRPDDLDKEESRKVVEGLLEEARLDAIQTWCSQVWTTTNPGLRYLLRELTYFVHAYRSAGAVLCGEPEPRQYTFKEKQAVERAAKGLQLEPPPRDFMTMPFAALTPLQVALGLPPPATLTETEVRATFPLIRRVKVVVRLSRQLWDLSALGNTSPFVLLDFPGLGAETSGVRDLYLCLSELREVQTILILLRGDKPGGDAGRRLYDIMQTTRQITRDNILVGVGRFDQLPLEPTQRDILNGWTGPTDASDPDDPFAPVVTLTENVVMEKVPILKDCLRSAEALVEPRRDRVVLLSPMLHLKLLRDENPTMHIGSETFVANLDGKADHLASTRALWRGLADRLEADVPGSRSKAGLARWLDEFASDGSISRLRHLLQSHVQDHGVEQIRCTAIERAARLKDALSRVAATAGPPAHADHRTNEDQIAKAKDRFRKLLAMYQNLAKEMENPTLKVERDGGKITLTDQLAEKVTMEVYGWKQWKALFESVYRGYVTQPEDEEDPLGAPTLIPTKSDDFYEAFGDTLNAMVAETNTLIAEGVDTWLRELNSRPEVAIAREDIVPKLNGKEPELEARLGKLELGKYGNRLVDGIRFAVEPPRLRAMIMARPEPTPSWLTADKLYPLARNEQALTFAWAREVLALPAELHPPQHHAHQAQVVRIRDTLVSMISQAMLQALGQRMQKVATEINRMLKAITDRLHLVVSEDRILEELYRPDQPAVGALSAGDDADSLVRQLANVDL